MGAFDVSVVVRHDDEHELGSLLDLV